MEATCAPGGTSFLPQGGISPICRAPPGPAPTPEAASRAHCPAHPSLCGPWFLTTAARSPSMSLLLLCVHIQLLGEMSHLRVCTGMAEPQGSLDSRRVKPM